jgi:hypothetical protein
MKKAAKYKYMSPQTYKDQADVIDGLTDLILGFLFKIYSLKKDLTITSFQVYNASSHINFAISYGL